MALKFLQTIILLSSIPALAFAKSDIPIERTFELYAYGHEIRGLRIFAADGRFQHPEAKRQHPKTICYLTSSEIGRPVFGHIEPRDAMLVSNFFGKAILSIQQQWPNN